MTFSMRLLRNLFTTGAIILSSLSACKKFVEIPPPTTEITGTTVYSNGTSAAAVMTGLYSNMIANSGGFSSGYASIGWNMGLAADELTSYDPNNIVQTQFYQNALSSFTQGNSNYYFWTELYSDIYVTNAVLEGLKNSTGVTAPMKQQISGEAEFMRAFLYFYAANLYGAVPLATTTNYLVNNTLPRSSKTDVYAQIIADLLDAQSKLSAGYVAASGTSTTERTRPNAGAAAAMLARVYLYTGKWASAETAASTVINNSAQYGLDSLNAVFLANSTEAIWQLNPNNPGVNTLDAAYYVLQGPPSPGQINSVALSPSLLSTFEPRDNRFTKWLDTISSGGITYYYPFKYKVWQQNLPVTEYTMVLRLAEQYLIRAEARAQQGTTAGAIADLNMVRNRAGLPNYTGATDQASLLAAILHERQVEFFTEWGHRWFDLSRTNNLNTVMGSPGNVCKAKGGIWNPDWALLPIARQETQINPKLTQNPGY